MKFYVVIICLVSSLISHAHVQATSETAAAGSVSGANSSEAKPVPLSASPAESHPNAYTQLNAGSNPATLNRQILGREAGRDAAKLLLRSEPSGAQAWIDGLFIGKTPVLLLLAPGKHRIEIYGPRQKSASRALELLPRETSDVAVKLTVRYPTNVIVR